MRLTAKKVIRFIEKNLVHTEAPWEGKPFKLLRWQKDVVRDIYDDRDKKGARRCREVYIEAGKGNGKSPFIAALGIVELLCQGAGALVLSLAATFAQANETTFKTAKDMISASPTLGSICHVQVRKITAPKGCRWEVHTSDGTKGKAGYRPTCCILDELQEQQNRKLLDINEANQEKLEKRQPLLIVAGNAGTPGTIAHEWHERGMRFMKGEKSADLAGFKAFIFGLTPTENWKDKKLWIKANPAMGEIMTMEALERVYQKALKNPAIERRFRQLNLGQWLSTSQTGFIDMEAWDRCMGPLPAEDELRKMPTWLAFDMADIRDLTAAAQLWVGPDRRIYARVRHWMPQQTAADYEVSHEIPYSVWGSRGFVRLVASRTIDSQVKGEIAAELAHSATVGSARHVCYDAYHATDIVQKLEAGALTCEPIRGNYQGLTQPTIELAARIAAGTITIEPNECLRWQATNLHVAGDAAANVRPVKPAAKGRYAGTAHKKIDGVMAMILGLARAMRHANSLVEVKPNTGPVRIQCIAI